MLNYNSPNTTPSTIDGDGTKSKQMNTYFWLRKSLIDAQKEQYFMPLADTTNMPKHFGKRITMYHYVPLLDDRNINDQGIDATGAVIADGNLYGSSKDIGAISDKLPILGEEGGRVNRVGYTRLTLEGSIENFGFFYEFTQDSIDFDSDAEIMEHLARETVTGASQITEDVLQKDLLGAAATIHYAGEATSDAEITGEGATPSIVTYEDLRRLSITLDDNRTPKHTTIISGSSMTDTRTIGAGRLMYIGSELQPLVEDMRDMFNNPAFIPVHKYANAGNVLHGEIGTVANFRIIVVPQMLHWAGVGGAVTTNDGYRETDGNYDVFPMLVIGDKSFTTVGFQSGGKAFKFSIITKMPGREMATREDPYGKSGFSSIAWWYGFMGQRTERIGLIKTVAPL